MDIRQPVLGVRHVNILEEKRQQAKQKAEQQEKKRVREEMLS